MKYEIACPCGDKLAVEADSREDATGKMMEAGKTHMPDCSKAEMVKEKMAGKSEEECKGMMTSWIDEKMVEAPAA